LTLIRVAEMVRQRFHGLASYRRTADSCFFA
jgi:hypothetical protein